MISSARMARRAWWIGPIAVISTTLAAVGCGPIAYVSQTREASDAIDTARESQADKYAPYWWTRATQYLEKAREIAAHADFQGANRYSQLATDAAQKATEESRVAAHDPSKRPLDVTPDVAPAKIDTTPAPATLPAPKADPKVAPAKEAP